ncbi:hypothetical protein RQP46_003683 [Phenoliferia psychrophenolica]
MSHLSPTLSTLPPELKWLIARMARDQDELFRAPAYSLLPYTSATGGEGELRNQLIRWKDQSKSPYGLSLHMLAEVSRDWRDAASKFLNESIEAWRLVVVYANEQRLVHGLPDFIGGPNAPLAYERIKDRIRHVKVEQFPGRSSPAELECVLNVMEDLPNVDQVSLAAGDIVESGSDTDDEDEPPHSIAAAFLQAVTAHPDVGNRITSLTIAFDIDFDEITPPAKSTLASLIISLPSLIHLRIINPTELFWSLPDEDILKSALEGARHLTSLSLRLPPDYVNDEVEGFEQIRMHQRWLSWKPRLTVLDIVTDVFSMSLASFVAGVAPTLEHLSISFKNLEPNYNPQNRPPFYRPKYFPPNTSFPLLSHLQLSGDENDIILEGFLDSPISHLHITTTGHDSCTLIADPSTLDPYLPTLRDLRLDFEPSQPSKRHEELRQRCEDEGVVLCIKPGTAISECTPYVYSAEALSETSILLMGRAQEQARINAAAGDTARAAQLEKALDAVRVLLKMQME